MRALLLALISIAVLVFFVNALGLIAFGIFAPRVEAVRFKTFQESQTYNEAMIRDLGEIQRDYIKATPDGKLALRSIAIHRFEVYPIDRLPSDLQYFYFQLKDSK